MQISGSRRRRCDICGLVGIFGKNLSPTQEKIFRDLLYLDTLRGEHSTGAAIVSVPTVPNQPEKVEVVKEVGPAAALFAAHGKFQGKYALTNVSGIKALIGHNRFATQGAITVENAHPFELGQVVGAHNGTVQKYYLKGLHESEKYEVDSQIIYSHLGAGNSINSVWEVADGALALTWYDKEVKKLNIARNKERTLFMTKSKDKKVLYWASEAWMIYIATSRNNIREIEEVVPVNPDKLYQFSYNDSGELVSEETDIPPFVRKPVVSYTGWNSGRSMWEGGTDYDNWNKTTKSTVTSLRPLMKIKITDVVKNPHNPHAFGSTEDGDDVKIYFRNPKAAQQQINNIMQRKRNNGVYVTEKYHRLLNGGNSVKAWTCDYNDLRYVKNASLANGFEEEVLTSDEWTAKTKCGCTVCQVVPSWKARDDIHWIDSNTFVCWECKKLPWVRELEERYIVGDY